MVERYKDVSKRASRPEVLGGIGPFAGLFALGNKYRDPVIVASTDGVGTKVKLAALAGRYESIGHDIVYACVNDLLTTGAEPLFFLDYIGSDGLPQDAKVAVVKGIADACAGLGMALLGGETADMPGVYPPGEFDLVGFVVGVVEREALIDGTKIVAGDVLYALPSNGLHTNGYSLVRPALDIGMDASRVDDDRRRLERYEEELGETLADALLRPHEDYVGTLRPAIGQRRRQRACRTSPAAGWKRTSRGSCRTGSARGSSEAVGTCRRCSASCSARAASTKTRCTACSTWASAW